MYVYYNNLLKASSTCSEVCFINQWNVFPFTLDICMLLVPMSSPIQCRRMVMT